MHKYINKIDGKLEDPIIKLKNTINDIQAQSKDILWKSIKYYSKHNKNTINKISMHDNDTLLNNGFSILINSNGNIIKDGAELFDETKPIKLIHASGEYEIQLIKLNK